MASAKQAGLTEINQKKAGLDLTKYSEENVEEINNLYNEAKTAIENATTSAEVDSAVSAFNTAIDAVPTADDKPQGSSVGCAGSVNGLGGAMALLTLCAVVFVSRKRR